MFLLGNIEGLFFCSSIHQMDTCKPVLGDIYAIPFRKLLCRIMFYALGNCEIKKHRFVENVGIKVQLSNGIDYFYITLQGCEKTISKVFGNRLISYESSVIASSTYDSQYTDAKLEYAKQFGVDVHQTLYHMIECNFCEKEKITGTSVDPSKLINLSLTDSSSIEMTQSSQVTSRYLDGQSSSSSSSGASIRPCQCTRQSTSIDDKTLDVLRMTEAEYVEKVTCAMLDTIDNLKSKLNLCPIASEFLVFDRTTHIGTKIDIIALSGNLDIVVVSIKTGKYGRAAYPGFSPGSYMRAPFTTVVDSIQNRHNLQIMLEMYLLNVVCGIPAKNGIIHYTAYSSTKTIMTKYDDIIEEEDVLDCLLPIETRNLDVIIKQLQCRNLEEVFQKIRSAFFCQGG